MGLMSLKVAIVLASLKHNCLTTFLFLMSTLESLSASVYQISLDFHFVLGLSNMTLAGLQSPSPSPPAVRAR